MTLAPIEAVLPEPRTTGHYLLHSLIRHADRHGVDRRRVSEIAQKMKMDQGVVWDTLEDLLDAGVVQRVDGVNQILIRCNCRVARERAGQVRSEQSYLTDASLLCETSFQSIFIEDEGQRRSELGQSSIRREPGSEALAGVGERQWTGLPRNIPGTHQAPRRTGRPINPDSAMGLAKYFDWELRSAGAKGYPTNVAALARTFAQLKRQGLEPIRIRAMIDRFAKHPLWYKGKPPWKSFISRQEQLLEDTKLIRETPEKGTPEFSDYLSGRGAFAPKKKVTVYDFMPKDRNSPEWKDWLHSRGEFKDLAQRIKELNTEEPA